MKNYQKEPILICFASGLFFLFNLFQMSMLNVISQDLIQAWHISIKQFSFLGIIYFLSATICFFPFGILIDKLSIRRLMLFSQFVNISSLIFFSLSHSFILALGLRLLMGTSYSLALLACFKLVAYCYPNKLSFANGLVTTVGLFGGIIAQAPLAALSSTLGWRHALLIMAALGILILFIMLLFIKDGFNKKQKIAISNLTLPSKFEFRRLLFSRKIWLCAVYACLINTPILFLGDLWGGMVLMKTGGFTQLQAGQITSMLFMGIIMGCSLLGWLADKLSSYIVMQISTIMLFLLTTLLFVIYPLPISILIFLYLVYGILASAQSLVYPIMIKSYSIQDVGYITGVASSIIMMGNTILQLLFSAMVTNHHWYNKSNALSHIITNYMYALSIIPISCLMGLYILKLINTPLARSNFLK